MWAAPAWRSSLPTDGSLFFFNLRKLAFPFPFFNTILLLQRRGLVVRCTTGSGAFGGEKEGQRYSSCHVHRRFCLPSTAKKGGGRGSRRPKSFSLTFLVYGSENLKIRSLIPLYGYACFKKSRKVLVSDTVPSLCGVLLYDGSSKSAFLGRVCSTDATLWVEFLCYSPWNERSGLWVCTPCVGRRPSRNPSVPISCEDTG
ncbi:hypothetical protein QBC47DRAFT_112551 [Echria macrotheca]|uniref:Uncharacterized protein n=1 Tax=Echria macrotheca TaxID=438768 RepID=A0AAJ0BLY6_9PEZI|nr:hypothetical protein QBC47DRAFT_112551 [Echria macrotheca]